MLLLPCVLSGKLLISYVSISWVIILHYVMSITLTHMQSTSEVPDT